MKRSITWVTLDVGCGYTEHRFRFRELIGPHVCDGCFKGWEKIGRGEYEKRPPILNMKKRKK